MSQGYAKLDQRAAGIHTRLYARAFVFAERDAPSNRVAFVSLDACMASQLVTIHVVKRLREYVMYPAGVRSERP